MAELVVATDAAVAAIESLTAKHGRLMLMQSGGCCDGSSPICLHAGELLTGPNDLLLGAPGGTPFYIDAEQYERWNRPQIILDAAPGAAEGFSLEGLEGIHFVTCSRACQR
jgi:uncharacterized protein (DUF779 family)